MVKETSAFVRKLAHNSPATRKAAFVALTSYLQSPAGQKLRFLDLEKLWKGLYFSMWFCDKPVPQQGLAGDLGELFSKVVPQQQLADFHRAFWAVLSREWYSIDKWRLDKYLMLVRRVVRHLIFRLQDHQWAQTEVEEFASVLGEYPLKNDTKFPQSLAYHVVEIYLDELEYVVFKDFRDYSEENMGSEDDEESEVSDDSDDEETETKDEKSATEPETPVLNDEETAAKKAQVIAKTPLAQLIAPFEKLAATATATNKAMRRKIKEEILDDERLKTWGVVETPESESEDEWTGF